MSRRHPIIVVVTVIDIVFVLAAAAIVETLVVVVVVVPGSNVIPLPPPVPGLRKIDVHLGLPPGFRLSPLPDPGLTPPPGDQQDIC